ncbi:PHP domain-containing protein [Clostridium sediminicola]|uniref:PHP domain-containing protein n=1 Tax=Clostridium sediminicola TaxID=3114879 RepID=UPI0031F26C74
MVNKNLKVDLHIHSAASDGTWSPEKIVNEIKKAKVELFSLTDHDSIGNVEKMKKLIFSEQLNFIPGIEISSTHNENLYHILAYGTDNSNEKLRKVLNRNTILLEEKDDNAIKNLIKDGYDINFDEYVNYKHISERGGWKALNFLIDKGYCKDVSDYFTRLFAGKKDMQFPIFEETEKVINVIKNAGGVAILAHPYYVEIDTPVEKRLGTLKDIGIEGVECYHPNHSKEKIVSCVEWCRKNDMIITAGSDCHGDFIKKRKIGMMNVSIDDISLKHLKDYII